MESLKTEKELKFIVRILAGQSTVVLCDGLNYYVSLGGLVRIHQMKKKQHAATCAAQQQVKQQKHVHTALLVVSGN